MDMKLTGQTLNITTDTVFLREIPGYYIVVAEPEHADHDWELVVKTARLEDRDVDHRELFDTGTGHLLWVVPK